ncbi:hypothetical protein JCM10908_001610 [Rhodotorula pacifica]|uniref:uncharacterized protein n=1 Tax=Rhodotorula pacifica TaxID=1495444 RepID=UPI00316BDE3E
MSSPDLATPAEEKDEWNAFGAEVRTIALKPTPSHAPASEPDRVTSQMRARSPISKWAAPVLPPSPEPTRTSRAREDSAPIDEATREASRAEALAKLTTPTPTSANFSRELDGFPFPVVEAAPVGVTLAVSQMELPPVTHIEPHAASLFLPHVGTSPDGPAQAPRLLRSNTVDAHPNPVPLDIDFRGRLVRARNSATSSASPALTISSTSSGSPLSAPRPESLDSRGSFASSRTASGGEETIAMRPGASPYAAQTSRATESAIDVLAIVDEDSPFPASPRLRARTSLARRSSQKRPQISPASGELVEDASEDSQVLPRPRNGPKPLRPYRLSTTERSFSSGLVTEPTIAEREKLGSSSLGGPTVILTASTPGVVEPAMTPAAGYALPRSQQRFLSDPALEDWSRNFVVPAGVQLPLRTRHESFGVSGDDSPNVHAPGTLETSRRWSTGAAVRTKLVVREHGKPVATYQLGECIGRGQFGTVYRALNLNTGQVVAVKRIALEGRTKEEISQLSNEVTLLQSLSHPAVVKYEGVVRTENHLNIILEYVENGSLQRTLKQFGQLPEGLVAGYVVKMLDGLAYLHSRGVVHCDLKAANVLSTKNGNIKLSDFGVSLNVHAIKTTRGLAAAANDVNGTPNWMAPEVISMDGPTSASDIWSLAATVCELITGHPPYHELVAMSAMFRIVEDDMPPLPESASFELRAFLRRCFSKDPSKRPTAEALFTDPWLLACAGDAAQDLRPQDSLPFIRRQSLDTRKVAFGTASGVPASPLTEQSPKHEYSPPVVSSQGSAQGSQELTHPPDADRRMSSNHSRPHDFIKITSSKAVGCRICGEQTRRHAVLCKDCGLIAHSRCQEFAPSCDLRASLLFSRYPTTPSRPQSGESTFSLSDWNPFARNRRSRQSSQRSSGDYSTAASSSRAKSPMRPVTNVLQAYVQSPGCSPPSSLGKTATSSLSSMSTVPSPRGGCATTASSAAPVAARQHRRAAEPSSKQHEHWPAVDLVPFSIAPTHPHTQHEPAGHLAPARISGSPLAAERL